MQKKLKKIDNKEDTWFSELGKGCIDTIFYSENIELKQTLEQLRTNLESFYSEIFTLATSKGYYSPTIKAKPEELTQIKNLFI